MAKAKTKTVPVTQRRVALNRIIDWLDKNRDQVDALVLTVGPKPGERITGGPNDEPDSTEKCDGFQVAVEVTGPAYENDEGKASLQVTDRTIGMATRLANRITAPSNPFGF